MTHAPADLEERNDRQYALYRRLVLAVLLLFFLVGPALGVFGRHQHLSEPVKWFLFGGSLVFVILTWIFAVAPGPPGAQPVPWLALALILCLGVAVFLVGQENFLTVLAVAAAACGRFSRSPQPAVIAAVVCAVAGCVVAVRTNAGFGNTAALIAVAPMSAFFAYAAGKRAEMVMALRRTRAELARAAVAEERLRIARDLHDLLGHSLSLITLKAELAGRVIGTDPDRAAREIGRTGVRRPAVAVRCTGGRGRLPAAGPGRGADSRPQLLDAAGIASDDQLSRAPSLPQEVDAAWPGPSGRAQPTSSGIPEPRTCRILVEQPGHRSQRRRSATTAAGGGRVGGSPGPADPVLAGAGRPAPARHWPGPVRAAPAPGWPDWPSASAAWAASWPPARSEPHGAFCSAWSCR